MCFNPRSRVGSDGQPFSGLSSEHCFNPRSRVGSDLNFSPCPRGLRCFNPRSRVGSDQALHSKSIGEQRFQSTLPRGERQQTQLDEYL